MHPMDTKYEDSNADMVIEMTALRAAEEPRLRSAITIPNARDIQVALTGVNVF